MHHVGVGVSWGGGDQWWGVVVEVECVGGGVKGEGDGVVEDGEGVGLGGCGGVDVGGHFGEGVLVWLDGQACAA